MLVQRLIELRCIENLDTATLAAKPVRYTDDPLRYNTTQGFAELSLYEPSFAVQMMLHEYTHTKSTDWEPEREWRIASSKRPGESGDYSDYYFFAEELKSITFGAKISNDDRDDLIMLIENGEYCDVELWQAELGSGRRLTRHKVTNHR